MESKSNREGDESTRSTPGDAPAIAATADHVAEAATSITREAEAIAARVKQTVAEAGEREKNFAAERMGQFAKAVHGAADELQSQLPEASGYIHEAAAGLERASSSLQQGSVEDVFAAFNKFAREQPALVFGGAILAGITFSRFLKSSGPGHHH